MNITMRSATRLAVLAIIAFSLFGCTAHSPFIITSTTDTAKASDKTYPAHINKVFVTQATVLPASNYEVIAKIDFGNVWYGSSKNVLVSMAERARALGADAVIEVETWHQPSGWSWAAPHGSGIAIKITNKEGMNLKNLEGTFY